MVQEWIRQNSLIYGALIAIGVYMVQPFLTAPSLDLSARICVVAFAVAIPLLAVGVHSAGYMPGAGPGAATVPPRRPAGRRRRWRPGHPRHHADLQPEEAERLADALAGLGRAPAATYAG
jgi:hypothetical protein